MIIRQVEIDEIAELGSLARDAYARAFGHSYAASDLAAILRDALSDESFRAAMTEDVILVAASDDQLLGFVQFGATSASTPAMVAGDQELKRLYVRSDRQNRGIGRRLIRTALDHPRLAAAERVFIDVWEHNLVAKRLYEQFGFEVIGAYKPAVASGLASDHDLIMVRDQAPPRRAGGR
jgi:ribosomal protein S18 acetylase RimI-like enzyme